MNCFSKSFAMMIVVSTICNGCLTHEIKKPIYLKAGPDPVVIEGRIEKTEVKDYLTETYVKIWIIKLNDPITVRDFSYENEDEYIWHKNVNLIQMGLNEEQYNKYRNFVDTDARVTGELFGGINCHHHTDVLIDVDDIKEKVLN